MKKFIFYMTTFFIACIILINLNVYYQSSDLIISEINDLKKADAVLILGASVKSGRMSDVLKDRTDTALEIYREKTDKILISGDNSSDYYDEVSVVEDYLLDKGVVKDDLILDYFGLDTYDSLYRAKNVFGVNSLIITTQNFHLRRALYIAKALGLEAYGFPADKHIYKDMIHNTMREKIANVKAFFDILFKVKPWTNNI